MADSASQERLNHVVVVMFENRSFDNLLGYLYAPGEVTSFEGVLGRKLSNPIPEYAPEAGRREVPVHPAEIMDIPDPDPGEEHPHTNTQMFGTVGPEDNRFRNALKMQPPFNAPDNPSAEPTMKGFVTDYINTYRAETGRLPKYEQYAQSMACFTPQQMPVVSTLARSFACFDHWFCEVPSQTFPNRSFFHAATSSGFVVNMPIENFPLHNQAETIFNRLESAGLSWKVYFDPIQLVSLTGMIHASQLEQYFPTRFVPMADFFADAKKGQLPAYAFIEPNVIPPHTDMHPPGAAKIRKYLPFWPRHSSLLGGEGLLAQIYEAVRSSATPGGSNYANSLLLITFDEHGGTFDHVPPPKAAPPDPSAPVGQMGFRFDRSGLRIPTLAISAWVDPQTVVNEEYRSTSVIRTLRERWSLGSSLTQRDAAARDIAPILTRESARPANEWPRVEPRHQPRLVSILDRFGRPLSPLGRHIFGAALAYEGKKAGKKSTFDMEGARTFRARQHIGALKHARFEKVTR